MGLAMNIQRFEDSEFKDEYNCRLRRLYPRPDVAKTNWGSAWAKIEPQKSTTPHQHLVSETFIIIAGEGEMTIEDDKEQVKAGDVIYIESNKMHSLKNISDNDDLEMINIWWNI